MGRHKERTDLGPLLRRHRCRPRARRGGHRQVRELTGGHGTRAALESVGHMPACEMAVGAVRPGGVISRSACPSTRTPRSASAASSARTSP
ncbi:hypothetical protein ACIHCM_10580 [Streptomyces sp. NPDC052023]|uniref:hypothetical protein n=1 Tax=Streptomyces sp. NPDC052023 TaxID=3365681 RepID=UPI0037D890C5